MSEAVKFLNYSFLPDDEITIESTQSLSNHINTFSENPLVSVNRLAA